MSCVCKVKYSHLIPAQTGAGNGHLKRGSYLKFKVTLPSPSPSVPKNAIISQNILLPHREVSKITY